MFRFVAMIGLMVLAGCAQVTRTDAVSFTDPAYRGKAFTALVVSVEHSGLQEQQAIENTAAQRLKLAGIDASAGMEFLPPTRNFSNTAKRRALAATTAQGVLVVTPTEKHTVQRYIPPSFSAGYSFPAARPDGRAVFVTQPGFYDPGYVLAEPRASYDVTLYSLPTYSTIWTAEFRVAGPSGMDFNTVGEKFADELVKRLAGDGLIIPRAKP